MARAGTRGAVTTGGRAGDVPGPRVGSATRSLAGLGGRAAVACAPESGFRLRKSAIPIFLLSFDPASPRLARMTSGGLRCAWAALALFVTAPAVLAATTVRKVEL